MCALEQPCPEAETCPAARTVLVVEDEVLIRDLIARHLRGSGYQVIEASDAREAMEVLASGETIDLLFTDVVMPGVMNGIMLARWVQQNRPGIRIVLASGRSDLAKSLPGERLFPKPYDPAEVEAYIRKLLDDT